MPTNVAFYPACRQIGYLQSLTQDKGKLLFIYNILLRVDAQVATHKAWRLILYCHDVITPDAIWLFHLAP
jgi:hypothetical protein